MSSDIAWLDAWDSLKALSSGALSSCDLTQALLERTAALNPKLNCLISVMAEEAMRAAATADKLRAGNKDVPALCGLPIIHKDIFCLQGHKTTSASRMLADWIPPYDAEVVSRLKRAGAVVLGKANMDEFAMGSSNETSFFGACVNPWTPPGEPARTPGGSSGGSAVAVASGLASIATGTDTGGSIRQPASHCGVVGLKPTYGLVSRRGIVAFSSSMDQAGFLARSARDVALGLREIVGFDPLDSTSIEYEAPDYLSALAERDSLHGMRIGVPTEYVELEGISTSVHSAFNESMETLRALGAEVEKISLPNAELALATYMVIASAEASSNLSRYDGVHFGYRTSQVNNSLEDLYMKTRSEGFGTEVKRRILLGTYVLSAGHYDAYYRRAQRVRRLLRQDFLDSFESFDLIACPTCPKPAFLTGSKNEDPVDMYLEDRLTNSVNLAGLPALSLPCGLDEKKLPIGLQLIGPDFSETKLLQAAHLYQRETQWHQHRPQSLVSEQIA